MATEHRPLAAAGRMFAVDDLTLPSAVRSRVRSDVIEERIAAPDKAVTQHHDTAVAGIDTVEHADVDGIEPVTDAVRANCTGPWRIGIIDVAKNDREMDAG